MVGVYTDTGELRVVVSAPIDLAADYVVPRNDDDGAAVALRWLHALSNVV